MRCKKVWSVVVSVCLSGVAVGLWAQSSRDEPERTKPPAEGDKVRIIEEMFVDPGMTRAVKVDTSSESWKQLADDVGIMLFTDRTGTQRGTLYVHSRDELWIPVALQGFQELGPDTLPLGSRLTDPGGAIQSR